MRRYLGLGPSDFEPESSKSWSGTMLLIVKLLIYHLKMLKKNCCLRHEPICLPKLYNRCQKHTIFQGSHNVNANLLRSQAYKIRQWCLVGMDCSGLQTSTLHFRCCSDSQFDSTLNLNHHLISWECFAKVFFSVMRWYLAQGLGYFEHANS